MAAPDAPLSVFLLCGEASGAPLSWKGRRFRTSPHERQAALANEKRVLVALVVNDMHGLPARENKENALHRMLVRLRGTMSAQFRSAAGGVLPLPVVVEAAWSGDLVKRGGVAKVLGEGITAKLLEVDHEGAAEGGAGPVGAPAPRLLAKSLKVSRSDVVGEGRPCKGLMVDLCVAAAEDL